MRHIVLFKLKKRNEANMDALVNVIMQMKGRLPMLEDIAAKKDFLGTDRSFDVMLEAKLAKEDLDAYANDPFHLACKEQMVPLIERSVTCDVE